MPLYWTSSQYIISCVCTITIRYTVYSSTTQQWVICSNTTQQHMGCYAHCEKQATQELYWPGSSMLPSTSSHSTWLAQMVWPPLPLPLLLPLPLPLSPNTSQCAVLVSFLLTATYANIACLTMRELYKNRGIVLPLQVRVLMSCDCHVTTMWLYAACFMYMHVGQEKETQICFDDHNVHCIMVRPNVTEHPSVVVS